MSPPIRRAALAAAVALLLVTAGCSGGTTTTSTATTTSATNGTTTATTTTTATGTWSPNASAEQYPPGVAANGTLANVTALLDAHFAGTANRSIAFTQRWANANESVVRRYAHGASATPYYSTYERTTDGEQYSAAFYGTNSRGYARATVDGETQYAVTQNASPNTRAWTNEPLSGPRLALGTTLTAGNYSVNGTVERGGRTFVHLSADGVSPDRSRLYDSYEGTVLVTPDGVVHDVEDSFVVTEDGTKKQTKSSMTLDTDTEFSGPPAWVSEIPQLSLSIVEDGHALELRNTGGTALPANVTFHVSASNERVWGPTPGTTAGDAGGTVTTETTLEPGDAVYVTADADGDASFTLHEESTRGDYDFGYAGLHGGTEHAAYRLVTGIKNVTGD